MGYKGQREQKAEQKLETTWRCGKGQDQQPKASPCIHEQEGQRLGTPCEPSSAEGLLALPSQHGVLVGSLTERENCPSYPSGVHMMLVNQ
jgi:hypothetical protein